MTTNFVLSGMPPSVARLSEKELRTWALEQLAHLDDLATRTTVDLKDRQLVEAFVERIEINPEAKTGVVYVAADLEGALLRSSTRLPIGDFMGNHEWCFYGWREGAAHVFLGPGVVSLVVEFRRHFQGKMPLGGRKVPGLVYDPHAACLQ